MSKRYVISLMAANRVGIMAAVTQALDDLGGDLLEVSQTVMQDYFTIILAADFPENLESDVIVDHISDSCKQYGVQVNLKNPEEESVQDDSSAQTDHYFLTVTGHDQKGIIRKISAKLSQERIDITDLYALRNEQDKAFHLIMELSIPFNVEKIKLKNELEKIGKLSGLNATFQHGNIFEATHDPRPVRILFDEEALDNV